MDTYTQALDDSKKSLRDFEILNGQVKETLSVTSPLSANAVLDA